MFILASQTLVCSRWGDRAVLGPGKQSSATGLIETPEKITTPASLFSLHTENDMLQRKGRRPVIRIIRMAPDVRTWIASAMRAGSGDSWR